MIKKRINHAKLNSIVEDIIKNYGPGKIILFGSGTNTGKREPNDFDLLIIKDTTTARLHRRKEALKHVSYDIPLDLIILTPQEVDILKEKNRCLSVIY